MPKPNRQQKNSLIYEGRAPRQGQIPRQGPIYGNTPTSNNVITPPEMQINTLPVKNREAENIRQGLTSGSNRFQGEKARQRGHSFREQQAANIRARDENRRYIMEYGSPMDKARGNFGALGRAAGFAGAPRMTEAGGEVGDRKRRRRNGNTMRGYSPENQERRAERQRLKRNERAANRSMLSGF